MVQNTIQLIQTIIKNCHFSLSLGAMLDLDLGSKFFGQIVLKTANIRIKILVGLFGFGGLLQTSDKLLGFTYRKSPGENLLRCLNLA